MRHRSTLGILGLALVLATAVAHADSRDQIESKSGAALLELRQFAPDVQRLLRRASGVLVFPDIVGMGFGTGGQYGEGALLVGGETVAYYATTGSRHQLPEGALRTAKVILFMTDDALVSFRNTVGWQIGVHGKVDLVRVVGDTVRPARAEHPVLALGFSDLGLMEGLDLNGNTINRIAR
ncbi:lipid-binding SYLF domain-containing protein [Haliea sp.]